ncbi:MAG: peptidoglycan-binding protein [Hydrogenibacillus schlegelii]|nr:peptidoglycan-binding protein [Hydrogenibacillus schlegelii]
MAISLQSKGSVFPSSSKTNAQTSKSSVQTSVATSGKAPAVSRGSSFVTSVRQDRVEISREARQLFSAKQNASDAAGQKLSSLPASTTNARAGTAVLAPKPGSPVASSSKPTLALAPGPAKLSPPPTPVTYNASGQKVSALPASTVDIKVGATTVTGSSSSVTLRRGSSGDDVRRMQQMLVSAGYKVSVDGKFGPQTEATVRQFQKDRGLIADGVVGRQTMTALTTVYAMKQASAPMQTASPRSGSHVQSSSTGRRDDTALQTALQDASLATKAPGAVGSAFRASGGRLGSTPYVLTAHDPNLTPGKRSTSTLVLRDMTIRADNKNVLRLDGPHPHKGRQLGGHLNVERPSRVPKGMRGLDHQDLPPVFQKEAPLTSAQNLTKLSHEATIISVGVDAVRLGAAYRADGNRVGNHTLTTVGSVAGGWAGSWVGAEAGMGETCCAISLAWARRKVRGERSL